jgi:hypothetical protein
MALMGLCIVAGGNSQALQIKTGIDTYERPLPTTVEDGRKLSAGLVDTMNALIAAWEADHADAAAKVEAIIEGNRSVISSEKQASAALGAIPGGALAKTLALGIYSAGNPLGTLGGYYGGGGASAMWNVFNMFTLTGRVGAAWSPQFHPEASLAAEWWMF